MQSLKYSFKLIISVESSTAVIHMNQFQSCLRHIVVYRHELYKDMYYLFWGFVLGEGGLL